jgi:hypothetical protein
LEKQPAPACNKQEIVRVENGHMKLKVKKDGAGHRAQTIAD